MQLGNKKHQLEGDSLTQQHFKDAADSTKMVKKHLNTAYGRNLQNIAPNGTRQPMFGDFTGIDYHSMLNQVSQIDNVFGRLPAKVRNKFRNRPELVIDFISDPQNMKEAVKLGLIDPPEGFHMTEEREVDKNQEDLLKQDQAVPKPDDEANSHNGPKK